MHIVIIITVGDRDEAGRIARALVEERLAACVSIIGGIRSVFRWEGEITEGEECLLVVKTLGRLFNRVEERVRQLHSYEVPEIIAFRVEGGFEGYMEWVVSSVRAQERG